MALDQRRLKELLNYDQETGVFTWAVSRRRIRIGSVTGYVCLSGHVQIGVDGKLYYAHRLAWLYMTGRWPANEIDHINGNRADNRFINLREATRAENMRNVAVSVNSKSGFLGVTWLASRKKWRAEICLNGKNKSLGYFQDLELAALVASEARVKYFGEFARQQYNQGDTQL